MDMLGLSTWEKWRIEGAIREANTSPHKHCRTTIEFGKKKFRVVVYEERDTQAILRERTATV